MAWRTLIGVDCAVDAKNVGVALGRITENGLTISEVGMCSAKRLPADIVSEWVAKHPNALVAIDAPLGWPAPLATRLHQHRAGEALDGCPNELFRRETDRSVRSRVGKQTLDVGADRIARTAHAALQFLDEVRRKTGQALGLAWDATPTSGASAIEVYPAGTLKAPGLTFAGYKGSKEAATKKRRELVEAVDKKFDWTDQAKHQAESNDDALDACVCLLAAQDFLRGRAQGPDDPELARAEGWIWVRGDSDARSS